VFDRDGALTSPLPVIMRHPLPTPQILPRAIEELFAQVAARSTAGRASGPAREDGAAPDAGRAGDPAPVARVYRVSVSYLQLYNEQVGARSVATSGTPRVCQRCRPPPQPPTNLAHQVYDLLNPTHGQISAALARGGRVPGLRVRYSKTDDFYVENLFTFECGTSAEVGGGRWQGVGGGRGVGGCRVVGLRKRALSFCEGCWLCRMWAALAGT
jgi:hypothetical protein